MKLPIVLAAVLCAFAACFDSSDNPVGAGGDAGTTRPRLAFVTNAAVPFWAIAEAGAKHAAEAFDAEVSVHMPPTGSLQEQVRILRDVKAMGVQGIAVSPKKPSDMRRLLDDIAGSCWTLREAARVLRRALRHEGEIVPVTIARVRRRLGVPGNG